MSTLSMNAAKKSSNTSIKNKWSSKRAALAATVISYRFKSAVRDAEKALGLQEAQLDYFIKNTNRRDKSLGWQVPTHAIRGYSLTPLKGQQFIHLVNEIIGFPRQISACGRLWSLLDPLYELVPVENAAMHDRTIIQWDKDDLETLGCLKLMYHLHLVCCCLRHSKMLDLIKRIHGRSLTIAEITRLKDDPQVYGMIQRADTVGIFQIESRAQMSIFRCFKPRTYYDLVIQIAIVRPGPIQGDMVHPISSAVMVLSQSAIPRKRLNPFYRALWVCLYSKSKW